MGGNSMTEMSGADLIATERQRQLNREGYTPEHDAEHGPQQLALAAIAYAIHRGGLLEPDWWPLRFWPWRIHEVRPADNRVRDLTKPAAHIAAASDAERGSAARGSCPPCEHIIYESWAICGDV